jgi:hypothetical protein
LLLLKERHLEDLEKEFGVLWLYRSRRLTKNLIKAEAEYKATYRDALEKQNGRGYSSAKNPGTTGSGYQHSNDDGQYENLDLRKLKVEFDEQRKQLRHRRIQNWLSLDDVLNDGETLTSPSCQNRGAAHMFSPLQGGCWFRSIITSDNLACWFHL